MLTQNFGVTNKEDYGMLWYFWSGQLRWQGNAKMASQAETFQTKKSANGFILSNHENEKSQLINMTKNCEKLQVAKIRQIYDFSQFSQILLNRQLSLDFSGY